MTDGYIEAEEKVGIFMLDSKFEDDILVNYAHLVPARLAVVILTSVDSSFFPNLSEHRPFQLANISPHGWNIPIYLDDCVYRI